MIAGQIAVPPTPVHSKGSTTAAAPFQLGPVVEGRRAARARPHIRIAESTGGVELRVVYWTSTDGVSFSGSGSTLASYTSFVSTSDWTWGSALDTLTASPYVRFGVEVRNISGSNVEMCLVEIEIDLLST